MNKYRKIVLKILPVLFVIVIITGTVLANPVRGLNPNFSVGGDNEIGAITNVATRIWTSFQLILQILAIAAIIVAGVRYMFASANEKADIKKQTLVLVVGAAFVFAAIPIVNFILKIFTQLREASGLGL